jgi:thioredoxin-related protein
MKSICLQRTARGDATSCAKVRRLSERMGTVCSISTFRIVGIAAIALMAASCSQSAELPDTEDSTSGSGVAANASGDANAGADWAFADTGLWQTNFEAARSKAWAENKLLLVNFTGSDWCRWCMRLKSEVFDRDSFQAEAPRHFVLVELDFPVAKNISAKLRQQNETLSKRYGVRGYPTILLLDAEGKCVAETGYRPGGPSKYIEHLQTLLDVHEEVLAIKRQLAGANGLDRAKLLDRLIASYDRLGNRGGETKLWKKEIVALDADNAAGLKSKYEEQVLANEYTRLMAEYKTDEANAVAEKLARLHSPPSQPPLYVLALLVAIGSATLAIAVHTRQKRRQRATDTNGEQPGS